MGKQIDKRPIRLKAKFIDGLSGDVMWWDDDPKATGFGIRCYESGAKTFFVDYRIRGRHRRYSIGPYPRWSVEAARTEAQRLRKLIDTGVDIAGDKRVAREAPTVSDLVARYIEDHLPKKTVTGARLNDERRMLDLIADKLGRHTKVADVHDGDIEGMHRHITASKGRVRANRVLAICSKMFALSLRSREGENAPWRNQLIGNPCKGVARNTEEPKERFYSADELARITDAIAQYPGVAADCARLILLSGCRPGEAMQATWAEFEETGFWCKPSSHTKQRKVHRLPLSAAAIELIETLRQKRRGQEPWVFPGDKPSEHIAAMWHLWHHVRKAARLEKTARLYDLRHTYASAAAGSGLSLPIIGKLLGHTQPKTTARYAHLASDPLRQAAERVANIITNADSADVVQLRGGK